VTTDIDAVAACATACEVIWVEGPDAAGFLQGLLTNDVVGLRSGASCRALLLDNKGHIQADMRVARTAAAEFTLVVASGQGDRVTALLDEFHFSEDVDIIGPEPFACLTVTGVQTDAIVGADLVLSGLVPGTVDAVCVDADAIVASLGAAPIDANRLDALRIAAGVPLFDVDFTSANLVQEAGLEHETVSFDKGCYLGQETVARVHYRGQVNRRLRGLRLPAPVTPGTAVSAGDRQVGVVTSAAQSEKFGAIGLAILRREVAAGAEVRVDGMDEPAVAVELPFTERS
jgi:tRNA-modifying protein YgfZ